MGASPKSRQDATSRCVTMAAFLCLEVRGFQFGAPSSRCVLWMLTWVDTGPLMTQSIPESLPVGTPVVRESQTAEAHRGTWQPRRSYRNVGNDGSPCITCREFPHEWLP